jgi:hypothetical protein
MSASVLCYGNDFSIVGALIGALSILVMILLGWQIYNVIFIDKRINKKIEKAITETGEISKRANKQIKIDILIALLENCLQTNNQRTSFNTAARFFNEFNEYDKNEFENNREKIINALDVLIHKSKNGKYHKEREKRATGNEKNELINILYNLIRDSVLADKVEELIALIKADKFEKSESEENGGEEIDEIKVEKSPFSNLMEATRYYKTTRCIAIWSLAISILAIVFTIIFIVIARP